MKRKGPFVSRRRPPTHQALDLARRLYDPNWSPSPAEIAAAEAALDPSREPVQRALPLSAPTA